MKIYSDVMAESEEELKSLLMKVKEKNEKTGLKFNSLQRRHTDGSQTHEKMLNITHYQRNANQNHNEAPFHTSQNGCDPTVYKQ